MKLQIVIDKVEIYAALSSPETLNFTCFDNVVIEMETPTAVQKIACKRYSPRLFDTKRL